MCRVSRTEDSPSCGSRKLVQRTIGYAGFHSWIPHPDRTQYETALFMAALSVFWDFHVK
jgi:hypothetical protein